MKNPNIIGKREFIHHTSRYIKLAETEGAVIITHQNKPVLKLIRLEEKSIKDLRGVISDFKVTGDINDPDLEGFDKW